MIGWAVELAAGLAGIAAAAAGAVRAAERAAPPLGRFVEVDGRRLHVVDRAGRGAARPGADRPTLLFLHGASGNGRDLILAFGEAFGEHRALFVDRPGLGWSERRAGEATPAAQAAAMVGLLDALGIERVVAIGHSWGAAAALALALAAPERVAGLVLLGPVSHPWPGGVDGVHHAALLPGLGPLFRRLVVPVVGRLVMARSTREVFAPDAVPEGYGRANGSALVLSPGRFRANAEDMVGLKAALAATVPAYATISAPTLIVQGDGDTVVKPSIHAEALARTIAGARLVGLAGVGHMPQHGARERVTAEIAAHLAAIGRDG